MHDTFVRPMEPHEREKLDEFSRVDDPLTTTGLILRLLLIAGGATIVLLPAWQRGEVRQLVPFVLLAALLVAGFSVYQYFRDAAAQAEHDERRERALADGRVEVEQFLVREAVVLEIPHCDWPCFVLELTSDKVALLQGPFLHHTADPLPSTHFELVTTRAEEVWLGIFNRGEPLPAPLRVAPEGFPPHDFPELVIVSGSLSDGVDELCRRAAAEAEQAV